MKFENVKVLGCTSEYLSKKEHDMFCWGRVTAIHKIGEYEIIEYLDRKVNGCSVTMEVLDKVQFHINGQGYSTNTLDQALIYCVASKNGHSKNTDFICRGLGIYN